MRPLIVACLVAVATSRPEGYSYSSPSRTDIQNSGSNGFISEKNRASNFDSSTSSQVPQIHKHIYVHVASPEPEVQQRQVISQSAAPQKHYKNVFIKTPSFPTPSTPVISAQAQNEENTLIYVLVKRPEDAPQISIPTVAPTQPSKPEVYFIKYKTQKETSPQPSFGSGGPQGNNERPDEGNYGGEGSNIGGYSPGVLGKGGHPDSNAEESVVKNYNPIPSQDFYLPPYSIKSTFGDGELNIRLNDTLPSQPSSGAAFGGEGRPDITK